MPSWDRLLELIKILKPEFYNKLTWVVVISGLTLMATPLWQEIAVAILNREFSLDLMPFGNSLWGFVLVLLGLAYHFSTTSLNHYVSFVAERQKADVEKEHDIAIFRGAADIAPEDHVQGFLDLLLSDHSFWQEDSRKLTSMAHYYSKIENQFICSELQRASATLVEATDKLTSWLSLNFFVYPEDQTGPNYRLCLYPRLNADRDWNGKVESLEKYDEFAAKLDEMVEQFYAAYREFRTLQSKCGWSSNISLQRTFDPPPAFAVAKACVASNAAELRWYSAIEIQQDSGRQ